MSMEAPVIYGFGILSPYSLPPPSLFSSAQDIFWASGWIVEEAGLLRSSEIAPTGLVQNVGRRSLLGKSHCFLSKQKTEPSAVSREEHALSATASAASPARFPFQTEVTAILIRKVTHFCWPHENPVGHGQS